MKNRHATAVKRHAAALIAVTCLAATAFIINGCAANDSLTAPGTSASASSDFTQDPATTHANGSGQVSAERLDLVSQAAKSMVDKSGDDVIAFGPPRPTVVRNAGVSQTMIIRDVSEMSIAAGDYILTIFCSGDGALVSAIRIDEQTVLGPEQQCGDSGTSTDEIRIHQPDHASTMEVRVMPIGATTAGVAYVVARA